MRSPAGLSETLHCELHPPLDAQKARIESSRCYYCYDAPCIQACPTQIDIPSFIRKIGNGNFKGAAMDILSANILGGTCARVCPVETLCQKACVRNKAEEEPVRIGELQRYATDEFFKTAQEHPFRREKANGRHVAVVGAGPAGLACAHELARQGTEVTIFEAREKSGGLNEYGLAPYKVSGEFVQREIEFVLGAGGITLRHGMELGKNVTLRELREGHDAVFLSVGLGGTNALNIPGEELWGVLDAARFIERIRQEKDLSRIPVGRRVVVIGGGNTAIDIAVQMKRLGAEFVTVVYRRGEEQMGATHFERELARKSGVLIQTWAVPVRLAGDAKGVTAVEIERTRMSADGKLSGTGEFMTLVADQVFKAIGQKLHAERMGAAEELPEIAGGKIVVSEEFETTLPKVYAGGDCVGPGEALTVTAVRQGKLAAQAIHKKLGGRENG